VQAGGAVVPVGVDVVEDPYIPLEPPPPHAERNDSAKTASAKTPCDALRDPAKRRDRRDNIFIKFLRCCDCLLGCNVR
jgi:hypothetical protein